MGAMTNSFMVKFPQKKKHKHNSKYEEQFRTFARFYGHQPILMANRFDSDKTYLIAPNRCVGCTLESRTSSR